jgi:hypothetical protein
MRMETRRPLKRRRGRDMWPAFCGGAEDRPWRRLRAIEATRQGVVLGYSGGTEFAARESGRHCAPTNGARRKLSTPSLWLERPPHLFPSILRANDTVRVGDQFDDAMDAMAREIDRASASPDTAGSMPFDQIAVLLGIGRPNFPLISGIRSVATDDD